MFIYYIPYLYILYTYIFTNTLANTRVFFKFPNLGFFIYKREKCIFSQGFDIKIQEAQLCTIPQHLVNIQ